MKLYKDLNLSSNYCTILDQIPAVKLSVC